MTIGIICEYNPFHNGHLYHLQKIKELFPDSLIVLVMSGSITQRGDISVIDKWNKTEIALKYGIDLIIELPFIYACNSSDIFAKGAINILKELQVNKIIFGSETNNIDQLKQLADIQINSNDYQEITKSYLNLGLNYPTACSKALSNLTNISINQPNDLLGLSYIKEIKLQNTNIDSICIKRTNDYNSEKLSGKITSATSIRLAIKEKKDISSYVPKYTLRFLNNIKYLDDYFHLIKYQILSNDISDIYQINEKIKNRIYKYIKNSFSLEELIQNVKTKNYTYNRLKRLFIYILFHITNNDIKNFKNYIRILGFNNQGQRYLNKIKKDISLPLITNYSNSKGLLELDLKINSILCSILPVDKQIIEIKKEYTEKIKKNIDIDNNIC